MTRAAKKKVGQVVKVVKLNSGVPVDVDHPLYKRIGIIVDECLGSVDCGRSTSDTIWIKVLIGLDKNWYRPENLEVIE